MTDPAYAHTDLDHIAYSFLSLAELGDMCTLVGNAFFRPADFPYTVQRMGSNAQALAGPVRAEAVRSSQRTRTSPRFPF